MANPTLLEHVEAAIGRRPVEMGPLTGGCVGEVYRVRFENGDEAVVKVDESSAPRLDVEGYMLEYLAAHSALPAPRVLHSDPALLIMEFMEGGSSFSRDAEIHAAELLAELHAIRSDSHGLGRATLIGGLHQPNTESSSWIEFFRTERLLHMARMAHQEGRFGKDVLRRIELFGEKLDDLLDEPDHPSLLHGDVWTSNVLASGPRITAFIDPAVYYGHPEIELAFITLFSTFGKAFFDRYSKLRPVRDGFFDTRRDIYNMYPLLVHVRLFGGGYLGGVERVLTRHGC